MIEDKTSYLAKKFYKQLGASKIKSLTNNDRDKGSLNLILPSLQKGDKVLDLACGYGRISFLLAEKGFAVEGIDISPNLIEDAKLESKKRGLGIIFKLGDFRKLSYDNESFDKIICLWSSFNHLLKEEDQIKALDEMYRVLQKKGKAIIEMPNGGSEWAREQIKKHGRVVPDKIEGTELLNYFHDKSTLKRLGQRTKFKQEIKLVSIAGRERLVWILEK
ncbi:MAG: class I SAM-dependent methyltransferase [archaeon]